jgi:hypothetical protein
LIDNVKSIGRGIGEAILPKLTEMVSEANKILAKFNELPDKVKFIGDVIDASMDVAFLSVKEKWKSMLKDMVADALKIDWMGLINPVEGQAMDALNALNQRKPGEQDMAVARARLKGLLGQVMPGGQQGNGRAPFQWQGPRQPGFAAGVLENMKPKSADIGAALGKMFTAIGNDPIAASIVSGAGGMIDRAKIQANAIAGTFSNWLGTEREQQDTIKKQEPQLAGAMAQGSQEAFSTIFAAMLKRGKDPNVTATEKQTKELKQALKENKPQKFVTMGLQFL